MVAYNFKSSFVPLIEAKTKQQTIRRDRKRHARPGEALQLYTGPRFHPVRLGLASCLEARQVILDFDQNRVVLDDSIELFADDDLNTFAIRDGFGARHGLQPWEFMGRWWAQTHPDVELFSGVLIVWGDTFAKAGDQ
ncbi:hypothetical protein OVA11_14130 [Caulobacter sp. SL161]|uniref:hypothetical protein n=1 Tax=Caulobacter sp. SL161 TaxID=2995156 RepID=UPI0022728A1E|nr:hypothetical protein [Caulobacter sp. SL161]MCY1648158.1 hypothetical protein [Caulobacter sp. SL161]